jgi:hypothetical protein
MKRAQTSSLNPGESPPHDLSSSESKLPRNALKLLTHIVEICRASPDRSCFKSIKNIAADCGLALQTAHSHKHLLRKLGLIRIEDRPNGERTNPRHRITITWDKLEPRHSTPRLSADGDGRRVRVPKSAGKRRARLSALSLWKELDRLDLISQYLKSGWKVCPAYAPVFQEDICMCSCTDGPNCRKVGKHPKLNEIAWARRFEGRHAKLIDHFSLNPLDNVGMWIPDGLMVVDFDDPQAEIETFPDGSPETLTCSTARGSHLYCPSSGRVKTLALRRRL